MAIEDFTTYTEVDPADDLTVTASKIDGVQVSRMNDVYVYDDKTANHFNALDIDYEYFNDSNSFMWGAVVGVGVTQTTVDELNGWVSPDCGMYSDAQVGGVRIFLIRGFFTASDSVTGLSQDTIYYNTFVRAADSDTVLLEIYSDSGRTSLVDTLSVAGYGTGTKWRYVYGYVNAAGGTAEPFEGFIQNMDLNEAADTFPVPGLIWTEALN